MTATRLSLLLGGCALAAALLLAARLPGPVERAVPGPGFGAGAVTPSTPLTQGWADVAGLLVGIDPDAVNDCEAGRPACFDAIVAEMTERFQRLGCVHAAPFAFTYLETTRSVAEHAARPDFFVDPQLTTQLDAVFARLYFDAFDNWSAGRVEEVPGAWRIAFEAAEAGSTSAAADIFLGMNAHITRDLAYAVAELRAGNPAAFDDPTDFLLINEVIANVQAPMLAGAAERFDPMLSELASLVPPEAGVTSVDLIARWRQQSFDLGFRLAAATSDDGRATVAAEIERNAAAAAALILNADSSLVTDGPPFDREGYCGSRS